MPTCKVRWIVPENGDVPTPDDNEAVGYVLCFSAADLEWHPICENHLVQLPREGWTFRRLADATEEKRAEWLAEIKVVTQAIRDAFPRSAYEILPKLRWHPGDDMYSFVKWGMFVGVEKDGYIHT